MLSQSLGELPESLAQWMAGGNGLQELPLDLPLAGNMLPSEGGEPLATLEEGVSAEALQAWLAALPISVRNVDAPLADAGMDLTDLRLNADGTRPQAEHTWIRNAVLASMTGRDLPAAGSATGAVRTEAALSAAAEGADSAAQLLPLPARSETPSQIRGMALEQALSQMMQAAGDAKSGAQPRQVALDTLAALPQAAATPVAVPLQSAPVAVTPGGGQAFSIDIPPGQAGWNEAVGEKVTWLMQNNQSSAQVRLNPPHLGPMEIRVAMSNDQANVTFTVHHQVTADQLEAAMPRLREMLADNGLQLANLDVRHQGGDAQREAAGDSAAGTGGGADPESDLTLTDQTSTVSSAHTMGNGLLDTYA